jgi:adenylate cyclase
VRKDARAAEEGMRRGALLIGGLTALLLVALWGRELAPFGTLEGETLDWRFALRGPIAPSGEVVIVAIDEASIRALGRWPLPRQVLAQAVERLSAAGARVIAFDLQLQELEQPTIGGGPGPGDQQLIAAIRSAPQVILPFAFSFSDAPGSAPMREDVAKSALPVRLGEPDAAGLGHPASFSAPPRQLLEVSHTAHATVTVEPDGALRMIDLVVAFAGEIYPALPLEAVRLHQGLARDRVIVDFERGVRLGERRIETAPGLRLPVNYYGPPGAFDTIAIEELVAGTVDPQRIAGKLVLVGATAPGLGDFFPAPYGRLLPGVEVLATAADNLLSDRWLRRDRSAALVDLVAIVSASLLAATIGAVLPPALAATGLIALAGLWFATATLAFARFELWLNLIFPLTALALAGGAAILRHAIFDGRKRRTAERERGHLVRYVPEAIADELARSDHPHFDERTQPASILFVDVVGFTRTTESMQGPAMLRLVRRLHAVIEAAVREHGGVVEKYIGDGAMILFGLPEPRYDDAARALTCARAIAGAVDRWNEERATAGEPAIAIGAGLHHGPVIVARVGDRHAQVTAMGDAVNVASRLERITRELSARIVLSEAVAAAVRALGRTDLMAGFSYEGERPIRGRDQTIGVWRWPAAASEVEREAQAG